MEYFWENDQRSEFLTYFGVQSGPKIGPLRPIFSTHLKVLAMCMWSNTDVKPVETSWENYQRTEFWWGPKWPRNWASEAHIPHTAESTCNEHVKRCWCDTSENFEKVTKVDNFDLRWGPKFGLCGPYCTHLWKYFQWAYKARLIWIQRIK